MGSAGRNAANAVLARKTVANKTNNGGKRKIP
jgi:hypothetical protein